MPRITSELQEEIRHGICVKDSEFQNLCGFPRFEGDLHLKVVLPCDLCPHYHQSDHRLPRESEGYGDGGWSQIENNNEHLTDEELDVAAQLMELSSRSLNIVEEMLTNSMYFAVYSLRQSSSASDSKRSCDPTPSPDRVSWEKRKSRKKINVEIDERCKPRSRSVSEIISNQDLQDLQSTATAFKRKKAKARA